MPEDASGIAHGQGPIIVKKVKKGEHGHHGGAWKVAYADMVTALMALFIVLWILSQSEEVIQSVAGYFRDPVGFKDGGVPTLVEGGTKAGDAQSTQDDDPASAAAAEAKRMESKWRDNAAQIQVALSNVDNIDAYSDQIEISLSSEGLHITLLEKTESPLFEIGGTQINPEARDILEAIAQVVGKLHNYIAIEGHTDSVQFAAGSGRSNWELSTGRAHTARKVLEDAGIENKRMFEVRGLADRMLYNPLDARDSRNRRVAITVLSDSAYGRRNEHVAQTLLSDEIVNR